MMAKLKRTFTPTRLRNIVVLLFLAVGMAVISPIISSHADAQAGPASPKENSPDGGPLSATHAASPSPAPTCGYCSLPRSFSETFDGVIPPTLPFGWLATNAVGPPPLWATSDSGVPSPPADTPPNAAFIDDPAVLSDKRLDSVSVGSFAACCAQLSFRHNFNLEASGDPNVGFDGGVLEISHDGGNTFRDILADGGSFFMGGYNRTIATDRGSPIAGRQAWSGNSQGFITSVVNLPIYGMFNKVRWRMASDNSGSGEGWRVDTVNITWCELLPCPTPSPKQTPTARPRPTPRPRLSP